MRMKVLLAVLLISLNIATYTSGEDEVLTTPNENIYVQEDQEIDENGWNSKGFNVITNSYYDVDGYDIEGWDQYGVDPNNNYTGTIYDINGYNRFGFDMEGYDIEGYDVNGYYKEDLIDFEDSYADKERESYWDENGYDKNGWNDEGFNVITNSYYDEDGYDLYGYDREGYDKGGWQNPHNGYNNKETGTPFDVDGYDKFGHYKYSRTKEEVDVTNEPSDTQKVKVEDKVPQKQTIIKQKEYYSEKKKTSFLTYIIGLFIFFLFLPLYLFYRALKPSKRKDTGRNNYFRKTPISSKNWGTNFYKIQNTPEPDRKNVAKDSDIERSSGKKYTVMNIKGRDQKVYIIGKKKFYKENGKYYNSRGDLIRDPEKYFRVVNADLYGYSGKRNLYTDWREWEERKR